jgi:DNA-binding FadR family transcriptional regulator
MATVPKFTPISRQGRLSAIAADRLAHMIADEKLPIGARLPSERRLATQLGVSRTVIREAIRLLEARRLVESQPGRGATVRGFNSDPFSESIRMLLESSTDEVTFEDVQEIRKALEMSSAGLAAVHASPHDQANMTEALDRMIHADTVHDQVQADYDFHLAIAAASHNRLFVLFLQALNDVLIRIWQDYWASHAALGTADYLLADRAQTESNSYHRQILDSILAGDADEARRMMQIMLEHWDGMYVSVEAQASNPLTD